MNYLKWIIYFIRKNKHFIILPGTWLKTGLLSASRSPRKSCSQSVRRIGLLPVSFYICSGFDCRFHVVDFLKELVFCHFSASLFSYSSINLSHARAFFCLTSGSCDLSSSTGNCPKMATNVFCLLQLTDPSCFTDDMFYQCTIIMICTRDMYRNLIPRKDTPCSIVG